MDSGVDAQLLRAGIGKSKKNVNERVNTLVSCIHRSEHALSRLKDCIQLTLSTQSNESAFMVCEREKYHTLIRAPSKVICKMFVSEQGAPIARTDTRTYAEHEHPAWILAHKSLAVADGSQADLPAECKSHTFRYKFKAHTNRALSLIVRVPLFPRVHVAGR